jgi:hypothetical protein
MMESVIHSTPRATDVVREQIRAVGLAMRGPAVGAAVLMLLGGLMIFANNVEPGSYHPERWLVPGLVGLIFPFGVWKGEELFGSGFLWTLPVDRRQHALTKVLAGWIWLMVGVAFFMIWLLVITLLSDGTIMAPETVLYLPNYSFPPKGTLDAASLQQIIVGPQPLLWLGPFTAATGTYLLGSSLAVGVRHPLRWVGGSVGALFLLSGVISEIGLRRGAQDVALLPMRVVSSIVLGTYGLDTLLAAATEAIRIDVTLSTGDVVPVWRKLPNVTEWATATFLWIVTGLALLWAAASRHRERRRG